METIRKPEIPYGHEITLVVAGLKILAVGNMTEIRQRGKKGRFVARTDEAVRFVKTLRSTFREGIRALQKRGELVVRDTRFPIAGKECQIRVNTFLAYGPEDKGLRSQDYDNVLKGTNDAIKMGPVYPGGEWGFIDDDRYIVGGYCEKGEAPDDGQGSRIILKISRARFRTPDEMAGLLGMGIPIFTPFRVQDQSNIIQGPSSGPLVLPGN